MYLPEPDEYAKEHGYKPFPPRWEKWLSALRQGILSAQPQAGRHVTVDEHPGKGTVINVDDTSARRGGPTGPPGPPVTGACCHVDTTCSIETETDCAEAGGTWLGPTFDCEPNPCTGCNCALPVSVLITATMTCADGGGWDCGELSGSTSYSRSFSAAEIQASSCTADDSIATCCLGECCGSPDNQKETETNGPFVSFHCSEGTLTMNAQVALDCFPCATPCGSCADCSIGSALSSATFNTPDHQINLSDATGTFVFDDHVSASFGENCTADIHCEFSF